MRLPATFERSARPLLAVAALALVLFVAVTAGLLDFLAADGHVARDRALGSLGAYWLAASLGVVAVAFASLHWRELLMSLAAAAVTLGVVEIVLRWSRLPWSMRRFAAVSSTDYHHIYRPNSDMFLGVFEGRPILVHTNQDGLRTGYTREEFGRYHERIVMVGDSFVFGYGVPEERGIAAVMERLLRDRLGDTSVAVLNAGIASSSPFLERRLIAGVLTQYRPTLVVLLLDASDIGDDLQYQREARGSGDRGAFDLATKEKAPYHGAVLELVRRASWYLPTERWPLAALAYPFKRPHPKEYDYYKFKVTIGNVLETNRFFIYRHPLDETRPYFSKTLDNINAAAAEAKGMHARFVLAIVPRFQHWNPAEAPDNWEKDDYALHEPYQYEYFRFFDEARPHVGYPIFDFLPAFQATREFPLVFREDPHWNERGHAFAARALANWLLETGMIAR